MYYLREDQIDFILNDIRARGIELEDLQSNLLDHICCIVEENLKDGDDFERFYSETIKRFFKNELSELEEETISLLTFKNYYAMKKTMIRSGAVSAILSLAGVILKIAHLPGASILTVLGITLFSLLFLPLLFILKAKEQQTTKDKFVLSLGTLGGIGISLAILFKLQHWPFATLLGFGAMGILLVLFLPVYFVSGIRNPATKVNTAVTSILLVAGCGLFMSLVNIKRSHWVIGEEMKVFTRNEQMIRNEEKQLGCFEGKHVPDSAQVELGRAIFQQCESLKGSLLEHETGVTTLGTDFEEKNIYIEDRSAGEYYDAQSDATARLKNLMSNIRAYNRKAESSRNATMSIPGQNSEIQLMALPIMVNLNYFSQVQLLVLQNEMELFCKSGVHAM